MLTFEQARRTVQVNDRHRPVDVAGRPYPVAGWGWENDEEFVVEFDYGDDPAPIEEPLRVVDKRSGELTFRSITARPMALRPINDPPG